MLCYNTIISKLNLIVCLVPARLNVRCTVVNACVDTRNVYTQ